MCPRLFVGLLLCVLCQFDVVAGDGTTAYAYRAERLNEWLRAQTKHFSTPLIEAASTPTMGLGVAVSPTGSNRIRKGSQILEMPLNATLCRARLLSIPDGYGSVLAAADEEQMIVLSVLVEHALGTASLFEPWLQAVPTPSEIQTPWQWGQEERRLIEPRSVAQMVTSVERSVRGAFDDARRRFFPALQQFVSRQVPSNPDAWTFERYAWARALVDTRAWNLQGKKYLVPLADFFNHEEDDEDRTYTFSRHVHSRSQKFLDFHKLSTVKGTKVLRVYSDRVGGAAGAPLYESYGDNTNDIYFAYHGFLPQRNTRDCQVIRLGSGLSGKDRESVNKQLLNIVVTDRGLQQFDLWSAPVCVHDGEYPPLLEVASWLVALGATPARPFKDLVLDCILTTWNGRTRTPMPGYEREDQLRRLMRTCIFQSQARGTPERGHVAKNEPERRRIVASTTPTVLQAFVNRTHRIQHTIVGANAKGDFLTIGLTAENTVLDGSPPSSSDEASRRRFTTMAFRKARKIILKGVFRSIRASQKAGIEDVHNQLAEIDGNVRDEL